MPKEIYDKLIKKLLEYNQDINDGMEISYVNYIKKCQALDPDSDFFKTCEMQKHLKRCYLEQFKNQSLDLVLLLFESVMRIISTTGMTKDDLIRAG